ncbi:MAG: hypothetical protein M0Q88_03080 [Bacilli bacterium]|nr:hypothetical protein [Bacilli bacterium]
MNNKDLDTPIISIKKIEKNLSKTYTDTQSNILTIEKLSNITGRSFNEIIKELVNNFIQNGKIFEPDEEKYYSVEEIIKKYKGEEQITENKYE